MKRARTLVVEALTAGLPGLDELAVRLRLSSSALRRYRLGNRTPSPAVLRALAEELRRQGKRLERLAYNLEAEAKRGREHA